MYDDVHSHTMCVDMGDVWQFSLLSGTSMAKLFILHRGLKIVNVPSHTHSYNVRGCD